MKTNNQKGSTAIVVIFTIIVLTSAVAIGYIMYNKQKTKNDNVTTSVTTSDSNSESLKSLTAQDAATKLVDKVNDLATDKYTLEKRDSGETEFKVSSNQTVTVAKNDGISYYADQLQPGFDAYATYVSDSEKDLVALNLYASNTLGLNQVYEYEEETPAGYTFKNTVYKVGDTYLEVTGSANGYSFAWAK